MYVQGCTPLVYIRRKRKPGIPSFLYLVNSPHYSLGSIYHLADLHQVTARLLVSLRPLELPTTPQVLSRYGLQATKGSKPP
jgi:hypothetical protein